MTKNFEIIGIHDDDGTSECKLKIIKLKFNKNKI